MTYLGKNLKFSSVYTVPVATDGLKGNFPFIMSAKKMAKYMLKFEDLKKSRGYPSIFYFIVAHLLNFLPDRLVIHILKKI